MNTSRLERILNKTSNVLVVSSTANIRSEISLQLRNLNFDNLHQAKDLSATKRILRENEIDWIVCGSCAFEDFDLLTILSYLKEDQKFKGTVVSVFASEGHQGCIPICFEHGLATVHSSDFSAKSMDAALQEFLSEVAKCNGDLIELAAAYLRSHLKVKKMFSELAKLESALIDHYPNKPELLLRLAEANVMQKNYDDALTLLVQAKFINNGLSQEILKIYDQIKALTQKNQIASERRESSNETQKRPPKAFPIDLCVLIDNDSTAITYISRLLEDLGIKDVVAFDDSHEAWNWMRNHPEPSVIIQEWKLPKLSGPALIQRLRNHGYWKAPIIVTSSLVKQDELPLVKEMSVSNLLPKPFGKQDFLLALRWALQQQSRPTDQIAIEKKVQLCLKNKEFETANRLKSAYVADPKISQSRKLLMKAQFLYSEGKFDASKELAISSAKLSGADSLACLNLLGKCFIKLGQQKAALRCFELADKISPKNIERICDMTEMYIETGEFELAEKKLTSVRALDVGSTNVISSGLKLALATDDTVASQALMEKMETKSDIISYMNNKAVALIRNGDSSSAIELYSRTIRALSLRETELRAIVYYNLGLAYARLQMLKESREALNSAYDNSGDGIKHKVKSLIGRVEAAMREGRPLEIKSDTQGSVANESEKSKEKEIFRSVEIMPGDYGLYQLFSWQMELDSFTKTMLKGLRNKDVA